MIHISLNLSAHCIETELKRIYNRTLSRYFQKQGDPAELEVHLEVLHAAISSFDFAYLRAAYKELAGNSTAQVALVSDGRNMPVITINDLPI